MGRALSWMGRQVTRKMGRGVSRHPSSSRNRPRIPSIPRARTRPNYRDWEDELFARLRLKRIDYLVSSATYNVEPPTNQRAAADEAQLRLQKDYSLAMSIFFDMTSE